MITREMLEYIRSEEARGVTREAIRGSLMAHGGWELANIEHAFSMLPTGNSSPSFSYSFPISSIGMPVATEVKAHPVHEMLVNIYGVCITMLGDAVLVGGVLAAYFFIPLVHNFVNGLFGF